MDERLEFIAKSPDWWNNNLPNNSYSPEYYEFRHKYNRNIGWPVLTDSALNALNQICLNKTVVDVGAGTGFLTYALAHLCGIKCYAVDVLKKNQYKYTKDKHFVDICFPNKGNRYETDIILLSWPNYAINFGSTVVRNMKVGQMLIYEGEGWGGCTGNDKMHEILSSHFKELEFPEHKHWQFDGIHDYWSLYIKTSM